MKKSELIELLKELIRQELEEVSTSSATPGYMTPRAFSGKGTKDGVPLDRRKQIASGSGYVSEDINEGRYHDWRNNEEFTPRQKIGKSMREVNYTLKNLSKQIDMAVRLKSELKVDSSSYWKNTHKALSKIAERLVRLSNKIGKLQW